MCRVAPVVAVKVVVIGGRRVGGWRLTGRHSSDVNSEACPTSIATHNRLLTGQQTG